MATTYEAIATVTVGSGGAADIEFTSIPATYTDLCVLLSVRSDRSLTNDSLGLKPNGSTSNRSGRFLEGNGTAGSSSTSTSEIAYAALTGNTATSSTFSNILVYCPNYTSSNYKSFSAEGVSENNSTTAYASINAWLWSDTSAITSLQFISATGSNFMQYSTATLYGIKNS
jgi:hypothetical protein